MSLILLGAIAFAILVATAIFATNRANRIDDEVEPLKDTIDFEKYAEFNLISHKLKFQRILNYQRMDNGTV